MSLTSKFQFSGLIFIYFAILCVVFSCLNYCPSNNANSVFTLPSPLLLSMGNAGSVVIFGMNENKKALPVYALNLEKKGVK